MIFGPDGALYVGMGDGGSGGDPENRAQNMRFAARQAAADRRRDRPARVKIAALGLRNPWRFSFDRANGDLWIGDVGQGAIEEVDCPPCASSAGLQNFGWDVFEGRSRYEDERLRAAAGSSARSPSTRTTTGCSVTGGFVYRGKAVPALRGRYLYGDYCSGTIWSLKLAGGKVTGLRRESFKVQQPDVVRPGRDRGRALPGLGRRHDLPPGALAVSRRGGGGPAGSGPSAA